ncbi:ATP-grasp domain-containing protein [Sphingobacterium litopenaei]|uniref:Glutathione synthase n=1 Tax=Sphingobacterium litopenaei TaxID=2763500 RepID=A0ABR7YAS9_9SPHI|nr:glutathione synthase [Sphingobacterium litopenaei]MBD1428409.1 glutathione synthase [Sphingobacterium litopenaei]
MKIAFLINQTHKEESYFSTTWMALHALKRGHIIMYIGLADFVYVDDTHIDAHVRQIGPEVTVSDNEELLEKLKKQPKERISMMDVDILWLRFDPVMDMLNRPWAASMGLQFAQLLKKLGRLVINDPDELIQASNKLYLENFPREIRPKTVVTRNYSDILDFMNSQNDKIILKPLKGSGGKNVFMISPNELHNLKQTVEVIARDGYVIGQEYLPEATKGDMRFFLLDGEPIVIDGKYAALQRVQPQGEIRSNIHQGATAEVATVTEETLTLVKKVSDKLRSDGMYLVGLDIVGDKIMEINVFSPGALSAAGQLNGVDYMEYLITHLEQKAKTFYGS